MRDSIYTIPISEVFEPKCGCPVCRLYSILEERCVDYIMGAAMMEPDIRIVTNEKGFCAKHYEDMSKIKNRLSLALMLESHLAEIKKNGIKDIRKKAKKPAYKSVNDTCYVCETINHEIEKMIKNVLRQYAVEGEFRELFKNQEYLCLPHLELLLTMAYKNLPKKFLSQFESDSLALSEKYLDTVSNDISHFCKMFDYRNAGKDSDWGNSRDSLERAIAFLSGSKIV